MILKWVENKSWYSIYVWEFKYVGENRREKQNIERWNKRRNDRCRKIRLLGYWKQKEMIKLKDTGGYRRNRMDCERR